MVMKFHNFIIFEYFVTFLVRRLHSPAAWKALIKAHHPLISVKRDNVGEKESMAHRIDDINQRSLVTNLYINPKYAIKVSLESIVRLVCVTLCSTCLRGPC